MGIARIGRSSYNLQYLHLCFFFFRFYRGVYSVIVGQISTVVEELQQKVHTLEVDRNVLEYRKQLDQRQLV